ncbi:hypothetical protein DRP53_02750 [candidate division WOR-3 bacterium]|uniref:T9SS type A sorting domain-containing protein n=1 Tax=candidate division WOR-3 bacterium TaxID=2052148 RepID=A0A660SKU0_UNCW3|nr:MAG: hypothetical protein DRP53_02750 [candidate division WOR-3 bacterium]
MKPDLTGLGLYLLAVGIIYAQPVIVDWGSNGSGASDPKDIMYLVNPGEVVTFSVTTNEACDFSWEVNKKVVSTSSGTSSFFTFEVPHHDPDPSRCIWEIHVKAYNQNGEAHHEWVISILDESEAPDIFESFSDRKYKERTETDPWERPLLEWEGGSDKDPEDCYLVGDPWTSLRTPWDITQGTWIFWYKYSFKETHQAGNHVTFYPIAKNAWGGYTGTNYFTVTWNKNSDAHHHYGIGTDMYGESVSFSMEYDGAGWYENGEWQKVILIIKGNYYYVYKEVIHETLLPEGKIMFENYVYEPLISEVIPDWIAIYMRDMGEPNKPHIDNIMVFKGKYLFPERRIYVGEYAYDHVNAGDGKYGFAYKDGIIVEGRGVTLKDIADAINNPAIFSYNEAERTAICYKDLVVDEGAELIVKDETLKFHCNYPGEVAFVLDYGSRLYVENSTITSNTEHYWIWNNAGSTTHWGNESCTYWWHFDFQTYGPPGWSGHVPLDVAYHGSFIIKNSKIDNFGHLFLDSPYEIRIENTEFTDIHELDIGTYPSIGSGYEKARDFCKGDKSIWIYTDDVNINRFEMKDVKISDNEKPVNILFSINAHRDKLNVYNLDAKDDNILIKESMAQNGSQSHSCYANGAPYGSNSYITSGIGLVNCRFKNLIINPGKFTDCEGNPIEKYALVKYYLDVLVIDSLGKPVPGAEVFVINEVDAGYPAENMSEEKPYCTGEYNCFYHHYRVVQGKPVYSVQTGPDGHTPLPSDPQNTLIITDYKKTENDSLDGIKISWKLHHSYWAILEWEMYNRVHGRVIHETYKIPYSEFAQGDTHHVRLIYESEDSTFQLIIKNQKDSLIWDSGKKKVGTDIYPLGFNQIGFEVRKHPYATKEISWEPEGFIKLYSKVYRGEIEAWVDNMRIDVEGIGLIEDNNYSNDPGLIPIIDDGWEYYRLSNSTQGRSFTMEFDIAFPTLDADGPWVSVWFGSNFSQEVIPRNINYTYTVIASKGGLTGMVEGVDPDEAWYREDPMDPTYTVIIVLGKQKQPPEILVYPNPYRADMGWEKKIVFANLPKEATIWIYTIAGELVEKIEHKAETAGGIVEWDISDIASGIYIYLIKSKDFKKKGKIGVIK